MSQGGGGTGLPPEEFPSFSMICQAGVNYLQCDRMTQDGINRPIGDPHSSASQLNGCAVGISDHFVMVEAAGTPGLRTLRVQSDSQQTRETIVPKTLAAVDRSATAPAPGRGFDHWRAESIATRKKSP